MSIRSLNDVRTLEVLCNWECKIAGKDITDAVLLSEDDSGDDEALNLSDLINVETTVSFEVPDHRPDRHTDKPQVRFIIPSHELSCISSITVLCDSKVIEVFGDHSIYLDTVHSKTIEESSEFNIYECFIDLSKRKNKEVTLKFVKPARSNALWVYGILLKLKKVNTDSGASKINYENVQDLLKDARISEQANKSLDFIRDASSSSARFSGSGENTQSPENVLSPAIKNYIDQKFQILYDYLIVRDKSIHDRLDKVIDLIKSKK